MRQVKITNLNRPGSQPVTAGYCESFLCQLRGLTFRRELRPDEGLLLVQRSESRLEASIHMLGMYIDLAVIWLDSTRRVVDVRLARRWRPAYFPRAAAQYVLEAPVERLDDFAIGDRVSFEEVSFN
jgi:uncharacterized membrane protein (UPF0127 family)